MKARHWTIAAAVLAGAALTGVAQAQEAPPPAQEEVLAAPTATPPPQGPDWRAFSRSTTSVSLIAGGSLETQGEDVLVRVARVPLNGAPGDYSHVLDIFGVRCDAEQTHLVSSAEAYEDGELTEAFDADEPWSDVAPGTFDEGVFQIGCGRARATGTSFDSVKAYVDAGRP